MRAFLSHSSKDKDLVERVHASLGHKAAWLDRVEIEWGDLFLERITEAIESASDFVLFWSQHSAQSEWVRLELNMAFIRMLTDKAIRLRVVTIDDTDVPLHLKPYHHLKLTSSFDPVKEIVEGLTSLLGQPQRGTRNRFLNRSSELSRVEQAIDHPDCFLVALTGFQGIGKKSLVAEALRRFYEGTERVDIEVNRGTGPVEFAMQLKAAVFGLPLSEGLSNQELELELQLGIEEVARTGRFLTIANIQHWLDEDNRPVPPLTTIVESLASIPAMKRRPVFVTSTRRIQFEVSGATGVTSVYVDGLHPESMNTLIENWYELTTGQVISRADSTELSQQLHGHPIAAKLAAGLAATFGVPYLRNYPFELVKLRRDLATMLLNDINLTPESEILMESMAVIGNKIPTSILAAGTRLNDNEFQEAVSQCSRAGLIEHSDGLSVHPLLVDYFWRNQLHREDYKDLADSLAESVWAYTQKLDTSSVEFSRLLPTAFRLFTLAGDLDRALRIRVDLLGELTQAAILHYDRRDYQLADEYIQHVLEGDPQNWKMRLYRARIRIRQERWKDADSILSSMLRERPRDKSALHVMGWRYLREKNYPRSLEVLTSVIAQSEHVASLRDAAECLYMMDRTQEALAFIDRAKQVESGNPYVLDLEARIHEAMGNLNKAYDALFLAMIRNPKNWGFHHRLGRLKVAQGFPEAALAHFRKAREEDPNQFTPVSSLVATLLDLNIPDEVGELLGTLMENSHSPGETAIVRHLKARHLNAIGDREEAVNLIENEIGRGQNLAPNLGILAQIRMDLYDSTVNEFPATATVHLNQAKAAIERCQQIDPENTYARELLRKFNDRLTRHSI